MKRLLYLIIFFITFIFSFFAISFAEEDVTKVTALNYDNFSSMICISTNSTNSDAKNLFPQKYVQLENPKRIYFDIENAILVGEKQHLIFDNSVIKEIKLAQFSTTPNKVRTVVTFAEDYDTSKISLISLNNGIVVKLNQFALQNEYFHTVYDDKTTKSPYSDIIVNSKALQKVTMPVKTQSNASTKVVNDIQKAFAESTLQNADGTSYDSSIYIEMSSALKLRTKYFINQYMPKNNGLLISGTGQLSAEKPFYLKSPDRLVIDLPNTYLDKKINNREIHLCQDSSCKDIAKIGQFNLSTARVVITSENAQKYIPVYSQDLQSLFIANTEKLDHTSIAQTVSNLNKTYVKNVNSKTKELILSFTSPVVYSIVKNDKEISLYLFNVKSYNEQDLAKTLNNTYFQNLSVSLLPKTGIKISLGNLKRNDIINIQQGIDSKAIKISVTGDTNSIQSEKIIKPRRNVNKGKVVLDAGHGGTDYGAIREGINEKDITLDVTRKVEAILKSKGYKVALTRANDTYVSLEDRVSISENEEPEIFVSIHVNAAVSPEPFGVETHYYHDYSKDLADCVHKHLAQEIETKNRGLFKSKFYVINHTTDPAILVEIGFLSNPEERSEIITESRKQKTAKAISEGIIEYLKSTKHQERKEN